MGSIKKKLRFFDLHIVGIVSLVSARKLKCPSLARLGTFIVWLELEFSSSNSSLIYDDFFAKHNRVNYHAGEVFSLKINCPNQKSTNLYLFLKSFGQALKKMMRKNGKNIGEFLVSWFFKWTKNLTVYLW